MEILGPFGICCQYGVHLYRKGVHEKKRFQDGNCKSITFVSTSNEMGLAIRDYNNKVGNFKPGTLGEMNGMNFAEVPVTADATIEWILKWVK